jgi:hypothetical protein
VSGKETLDWKLFLSTVILSMGLAACAAENQTSQASQDQGAEASVSGRAESSEAPQGEVAMVTPDQACVAPEDIHFDTFRGGSIPFSEASTQDILRLRDAIPPITAPVYEDVSGGDWLNADDLILGYADGDEAYAYPLKILNFHEIVNEEINGQPVLISYCPLCQSGLVYSRLLDGQTLTFGNTSALYDSDMVMYDHQTGSYWHQVGGNAIVGSLCEESLTVLPSLTTTWAAWKELHPTTRILSQDTGFSINYLRDPFATYPDMLNGGRFAFPVSENGRDSRLNAADIVLGVELGDARRAYSLSQLGDAVVEDALSGRTIVVFSSADGPSGAAYFPEAGGQALTFQARDGQFIDQETGSVWNLAGAATEGPLEGTTLDPVPARQTFWFALVATFPDIEVYTA